MKIFDAVIAGYICIDLIPEFHKSKSVSFFEMFKPGRLNEIERLSIIPGGLVMNTGLAMKKFQKRVFLNGLIGNDMLGYALKKKLETYNLSEGISTTDEADTAVSIVIIPPGVEDRLFLESTGCNQVFNTDFIDFDAISQSRLFHFGYLPLLPQFYRNNGSMLIELLTEVKRKGVVTSMDFSLPDPESKSGKLKWPKIMSRILPVTDIFIPSLEEALQIMMPEEYTNLQLLNGQDEMIDRIPVDMVRELGKRIIDSGVKILLLKTAHRGAYLITGDVSGLNENCELNLCEKNWNHRELWCNAYHADNRRNLNSNGTGDTAAAAFLSAILDGIDPDYAIKYACLAGRNKLYINDIYNDLSDWNRMTEQIEAEPNEIINLSYSFQDSE